VLKILIVGGYGTFGGRLADLLASHEDLTLLVAGRNLTAARTFCRARVTAARLVPLQFDRSKPHAALDEVKPDIVVDASGPFQVYGGEAYVLPGACIARGINYLDLADGADFVLGISELDERAKAKGVFALSGMSSYPVLSTAVCRMLAQQFDTVETITAGIAPSPHARVGLNVVRAIASYAGKPVEVLHDGKWIKQTGFFDSRHMQVHVPGQVPSPPTRFALCDVPDLKILAHEFPDAKSIWMGAGPTPAVLHRLLWMAAWLVKNGILPSLLPFARLMNLVINVVRWGAHRGGFVLLMTGRKDGQHKAMSWHLAVEGDNGPFIPSMAAAAIIANGLNGKWPAVGARAGHRDVTLEDYAPRFKAKGIMTGVQDDTKLAPTIYAHVLGTAFDTLDEPVRRFHAATQTFALHGEAKISAPSNPFAYVVRKLFGFPSAAAAVPVKVEIGISERGEHWQRHFAGKLMQSWQYAGQGRDKGLIVERFGPLAFAIAVTVTDGALTMVPQRWRILGLPLPKFLMPKGQFHEHGRNGRFNFHVDIRVPLIGRVVMYEGWLA
jgi:hypothetical protein